MDKLTLLTNHHKDWVKVVNTFGEYFYADDIVQETYLKILRLNHIDKIVTTTINRSMMWLVIRSVYIDHLRLQKHEKVSLDTIYSLSYEDSLESQTAINKIDDLIEQETKKWHHYDKMLFDLYRKTELSMREIAEATGIHYTSIFHTLKRCKKRLQESVGEDYSDYLNKDFELIK
jgi:RNA polymerase sigma factor (sigma-70 family)